MMVKAHAKGRRGFGRYVPTFGSINKPRKAIANVKIATFREVSIGRRTNGGGRER